MDRVVGVVRPALTTQGTARGRSLRPACGPVGGGKAKAAEAMATNIPAMSAATEANNKMRFISIPFH